MFVHLGGIVNISISVPRVVRRHDILYLLLRVGSIPKPVVWRLGIRAKFRSSEDARDGVVTPHIDGPRLGNEHGVSIDRVEWLRISQ